MSHETIPIDEHVKLIQLQLSQADRMFELTEENREYLGRFLPWVPFVKTVDDSRKYIQETLETRADNTAYTYGIEYDNEIIGDISLRNLRDDTQPTEIGYWIDETYSGKGITTLATRALTDYGMETLGLSKIMIRAEPDNIASNKVAEKAGYTFSEQVDDEKYHALNVWVRERAE